MHHHHLHAPFRAQIAVLDCGAGTDFGGAKHYLAIIRISISLLDNVRREIVKGNMVVWW
jgi:hypothetical protein